MVGSVGRGGAGRGSGGGVVVGIRGVGGGDRGGEGQGIGGRVGVVGVRRWWGQG